MLHKIQQIFGISGNVIRKYPMVLLMAFLAAVSLICFAEKNFDAVATNFIFVKFALVCCLGISLMFALNMLSQRIGMGLIMEFFAVVLLVFLYLLLPDSEKDFTEVDAFLLIPTFILSHLLVSFIPFFGQKRELNFWQYNKSLFINTFLTAVFTGVLTGGVLLAILAVDQLFDFNFKGKYYFQTFQFLGIFGSCFIFLLFNEKGLKFLERVDRYPIILKFFTQYILIPLLIIYSVILYFYSAKILIHWELPRGWVSYLVLAYSIVGILAFLLVYPLKQDSEKSWVKVFPRIFFYTLIPLIVLLFTAIFTRILAYGYTEPRYFVLILAIWLTFVVLYFVFFRKTTIKFIPVSLFAFGVFSLMMPYLNTFSVAKGSQKTELKNILTQNNLLEDGKINFNKKVSDLAADEISSKFNFLAKRNEQEFLFTFLNSDDQKILAKSISKRDYWEIHNMIQNHFTQIQTTEKSHQENRLEIVSENKFHSIAGYEYVASAAKYKMGDLRFNGDIFTVSRQENTGKILAVTLNGREYWDVSPLILQYLNQYKNQSGQITVPEISFESDLGNYHLKMVFDNLIREKYQKEQIFYNEAYILIRQK
ncbi:DUF4153 domain-containing protein [Chryseobacterium sp. R2A-55]|uniref:DUF4153 domain-containing protein n=1 Tax=Chryseobacterium sp. R2A-55 TaxID=2744445 RepID=UPI001F37E7D3|nr:DUF4153 domain-containing protein [Chryseobacterium sp. R2A-55]